MDTQEKNAPTLKRRKWISVVITVLSAGLLTLLGIYGIGDYGMSLFGLIPLFIGLTSTIIYGYGRRISIKESLGIGSLTLTVYALALLIFAIEGLICIVMAFPIGLIFTFLGSLLGFLIVNKLSSGSAISVFLLLILIPTTAFIERDQKPEVRVVTTSVIIDASSEIVWQNVIRFSELPPPTDFIFNIGIAYPINARIEGEGVGAVRHCNFSTGSFVEPITTWDAPHLLQFDVVDQPEPMKELSFWDINAPHLHDYFVSQKGQFKLTDLPNGKTLLEGTTWYYHNIKPVFYWKTWSNLIIHKIHERVLEHIKAESES